MDIVISVECQKIYNQVFLLLLQIKWAKYSLDVLRFHGKTDHCNSLEWKICYNYVYSGMSYHFWLNAFSTYWLSLKGQKVLGKQELVKGGNNRRDRYCGKNLRHMHMCK